MCSLTPTATHCQCRTHCQCLLPTHSPGRLGMVCHQYRQSWGLQLWLFLPPSSLSPPPPHLLPHLTVIFRGAGFLFTWTTLQLLCICMHVCFVCVFVCVVCVCMYMCAYVHMCMCTCGMVEQCLRTGAALDLIAVSCALLLASLLLHFLLLLFELLLPF